ncbi:MULTISPECIES: hypothetical protein [Pasteurellaceae]|uniref:Uncharacterized protein n=1 Tax=Pasteurella atlantica TaxID=2827233 RepID=A0AAW8CHK9_9PAST|nr:hypothetical protein [Pasteurella atlantica]MBR0573472.1 hypothetical protein [Pasteurella atlantica]MDP8039473.1 hypothetical protein [Pasteurella atlantica]MDP8041564.1 hypothetical protein [Pasteurella atlantica]MDP8043701.1 hypothetical protein [Pasteurella atlantica]MDP8045802.1 hypothetical protein [Pasteurella atlantica]
MNKTRVKIQADGINIFFPYPLEYFLIAENTIEYVITKVGREMYATAISVNGHSFLQSNIDLPNKFEAFLIKKSVRMHK